ETPATAPAVPPDLAPAPVDTAAPPAPPISPPPTTAAPAEPVAIAPAAPPAPLDKDEMSPTDRLAGWSGEPVYLRSGDNQFVLMPGGRLQVDGYFFDRETDKMPTPSILLKRARLETFGWIGPWAFFNIGGDFAAGAPTSGQSWLATTDDYVGIAPWKNL